MNVVIVKELIVTWREAARPEPMGLSGDPIDSVEVDLIEKVKDDVRRKTIEKCAQDLEDVIRIYTEFKLRSKVSPRKREKVR